MFLFVPPAPQSPVAYPTSLELALLLRMVLNLLYPPHRVLVCSPPPQNLTEKKVLWWELDAGPSEIGDPFLLFPRADGKFRLLDISITGCVTSLLAVSKGSPKSQTQMRIFPGRAASKLEANRVFLVTYSEQTQGTSIGKWWQAVTTTLWEKTFRVNFGIRLGFGTFERALLISGLLFQLG